MTALIRRMSPFARVAALAAAVAFTHAAPARAVLPVGEVGAPDRALGSDRPQAAPVRPDDDGTPDTMEVRDEAGDAIPGTLSPFDIVSEASNR